MSCPQENVPAGWKVWRGAVPTELTQLAMDVRDHVRSYPYGSIAKTVNYSGQNVGVFVSHHTWTYKGGQLLTNICIPGCSLIVQQAPGAVGVSPMQDSLSTPDPTAAVYGADDVPIQHTNYTLVAVTATAIVATCAAFAYAIRAAGRARSKR